MCLVVSQQERTTALMPLASLRYLQSVRGKRSTEVTVHTCRVTGLDLLCGGFFSIFFRLCFCNHLKLAWPGLRRLRLGLKCPTSHDYPARRKMMLTQYITHKRLL